MYGSQIHFETLINFGLFIHKGNFVQFYWTDGLGAIRVRLWLFSIISWFKHSKKSCFVDVSTIWVRFLRGLSIFDFKYIVVVFCSTCRFSYIFPTHCKRTLYASKMTLYTYIYENWLYLQHLHLIRFDLQNSVKLQNNKKFICVFLILQNIFRPIQYFISSFLKTENHSVFLYSNSFTYKPLSHYLNDK